ncbi:unnamed protein product [Rhodiola kirilowii]
MDESSNRRAVNGHPDSRRASAIVAKRTPRSMSQTAQLGCTSRSNIAKSSQIICTENVNASKHSYRYAESKRAGGGSSLSSFSVNSSTRRLWEPKGKLIPKVQKILTESASRSGSPDRSIDHCSEVTSDIFLSEYHDGDYTSTEEVIPDTVSSPIVITEDNFTGKPVLSDLAGCGSSSKFKASQTNIPRFSHSSNRYFPKSSKYNSLVDSRVHKRMELLKGGNVKGESSSSGVKKTSPLKIGQTSCSARGKSVEKLRKHMYRSGWENYDASASTGRSAVPIRGLKPTNKKYGNQSAQDESNVIIQGQDVNGHEIPASISGSSMLDTNSSEKSIDHPVTSVNSTSSSDLIVVAGSVNQGGFPHHMDGVTEILLALERAGQVEQLSYERLLFLEMNSFFGGLSFHDQHRDMRLDIDNMCYEELLALEDRIGCVSTALTGEAIDRCLNKSFYKPTPSEVASIGFNRDEDDLKCSICQEEYVVGDEVGRLHCEHLYHWSCIQQWLNQKNWCPICKGSAVPS